MTLQVFGANPEPNISILDLQRLVKAANGQTRRGSQCLNLQSATTGADRKRSLGL